MWWSVRADCWRGSADAGRQPPPADKRETTGPERKHENERRGHPRVQVWGGGPGMDPAGSCGPDGAVSTVAAAGISPNREARVARSEQREIDHEIDIASRSMTRAAEAARVQAELGRAEGESVRVDDENARCVAEERREIAEAAREAVVQQVLAEIADLRARVQAVEAEVQTLRGGG